MKWYQTLKLLCWELCFNQISWRELARLTVSTLLLTVNFTVKISWQSRPTAKFNSPTFPPPPRYMSDRWLKEQIWLSQYLGANSMLEVLPGACPNCNCQPLKDFVNWKEPLKFNTTTTFNVNDFLTWKFPDLQYFFLHQYANGKFLQTLCVNCSRCFRKGYFCPVCLKVYRNDQSDSPMVCCDQCDRWIHTGTALW